MPGGDLAAQREPRAETERERLHEHAERLHERGDRPGPRARPGLRREHHLLAAAPAYSDARQHAHHGDRLRIAQIALRVLCRFERFVIRHGEIPARHGLVHERGEREYRRAPGAGDTEPGMEQEQNGKIERQPRGVEAREHRLAGEELAQLAQIVERSGGSGPPVARECAFEHGLEHP
jgi:hypothetical protein